MGRVNAYRGEGRVTAKDLQWGVGEKGSLLRTGNNFSLARRFSSFAVPKATTPPSPFRARGVHRSDGRSATAARKNTGACPG